MVTMIGCGLLAFSVGCLMIKTSPFTKVTHLNGVTIITDKKTGERYIQGTTGGITKLERGRN